MTGPTDREALYGAAGPGVPVPPGGRDEALHGSRVAGLDVNAPHGVRPCTCPPFTPHGCVTVPGCPSHDVAAAVRADLADALAAALDAADREALYGAGTGGPLVGILADGGELPGPGPELDDPPGYVWPALATMPASARALLVDAAGPGALQPQAASDQDARAALVRELAADAARQARHLIARNTSAADAQLDDRDRHAVAILADHGPVTITGRPVHALQLADGRAFTLHTRPDGRPQWRPTGPRPLIDTAPALHPCPAAHGAPCSLPTTSPSCCKYIERTAPWRPVTGTRADREAQYGPRAHPYECGRRPWLAAWGTGTHWPALARRGPACTCPPDDEPPQDVEPAQDGRQYPDDDPHECGMADGRPCLVPCPAAAGTAALCGRYTHEAAQDTPQDVDQEPAGPSSSGPAHQDGSGHHDRPAAALIADAVDALALADVASEHDQPDQPRALVLTARDRLQAAQDVAVRPLDVDCPTCWAWPRYGCQDEHGEDVPAHPARRRAAQDAAHGPAGPATPGRAPRAGSGRSGRPPTPSGLQPLDVDAVRALVDASAASASLAGPYEDDAAHLADVDDLADVARVDALAARVRDAGSWTRPRYALPQTEPALALHRDPLHAFTDAIERNQADIRAAGLPWPAPQERPGDREALHAHEAREARRCPADGTVCAHTCEDRPNCTQQARQAAQDAHDAVNARAHACSCLTRGPDDPPCPVAGPSHPQHTPEA